ncbi:MAG TPA: pyridoxal phosphate-dependent aminotransferase [Bryobacteraceae bacterium]|nr:pyridoxal phosphate-dependent aminotransferase [Bryobacteraceae bacterium]
MTLTTEQQNDFLARGFSRRSFGRLATLFAAGSSLPFCNEFALAQVAIDSRKLPPGAVKIDNNENPLGPCKEALDAMSAILPQGGRYMFYLPGELSEVMAAQEGISQKYVQVHDGSSAPLLQAVLSFTSPAHPYVMADPGYEAGSEAARFIGSNIVKVPLTKEWAHDVRKMAAVENAGLIYICNPNNPTGTLTKKEDIEWLVANKPAGCVVMIDEAYVHFAGKEEQTSIRLVAQEKDVIILRTFSKIYGMAGLRAGVAIGRPDLIRKTRGFGINWNPVTSVTGAMAALKAKEVVPQRKKINADIRDNTIAFLKKKGFVVIPSVSNKFMVDTRKPTREAIAALRKDLIYVGRPWPSMPTWIRVTVGTREEMDKFQAAFVKSFA